MHISIIILPILLGFSVLNGSAFAEASDSRPNILLIVADDLGYADLGIFGSEIRTPNIDALAREGLRFSQFHTAPLCAPTRAMLMSGNNNHVAGMARQHPFPPVKGQMAGYEEHLSDRIAPLPRVLSEAGYHTYTAGKWHLGEDVQHSARAAGFEKSFGVAEGAASHFDGRGFENAPTVYHEDGELAEWPDGAYSTDYYTDTLIGYIDANLGDGKPFFAYAAYTSPHWPLQVPESELDRYAGAYDAGYDHLREVNFENLKAAKIIPPDSVLPPRNPDIPLWTSLSDEEKRRSARAMELYAAMVENLDHNIGRLLAYLRENRLDDNTLVIFMSDNGADGLDFYNRGPFVDYIRAHYDNRWENMGGPDSFVSYDAPWAEAGSAPFRLYKGYATQGGIVAPMIAAGAGVTMKDEIRHCFATVMDIAPTIIEMAGARYPDDGSVQAMRGSSLVPLLGGQTNQAHADDEVTVLFQRNQAYVRQGNWKLTSIERPFDEAHFGLYDLSADPGETTDLSETHPEKRAEMIELWRSERR
ncbi:MAG: arylsulfatase, partial [Xanthomonadales bacterium]|nr:arylsulfatase [Xanthomonadales bacterium]